MSFWATLAIVFAACATIQVGAAKQAQQRAVLQFRAIDKCKNVEPYLDFVNTTISRSKYGANVLSATLNNRKLVKSFSKMELSISKCTDAVSFNTCEYEGTHKFSVGLCQLIASQAMPWSSFLTSIHPPIRCPLQPGFYILANGTVDMTEVLKAVGPTFLESTFKNVYMTEVRCFNEKSEVHVCFRITYSMNRVRS